MGMDSIPHWGTKIPHATQCSLYMCVCVYIYIEREREKERERERGWLERSEIGLCRIRIIEVITLLLLFPSKAR